MSKDKKSSYYDVGGIEVLEVIKSKLTPEQYSGFLLGNAIKYNLRMFHKNEQLTDIIRDSEKSANYSCWLSEHLKNGDDL